MFQEQDTLWELRVAPADSQQGNGDLGPHLRNQPSDSQAGELGSGSPRTPERSTHLPTPYPWPTMNRGTCNVHRH